MTPSTLEQRVEVLERAFAEFKAQFSREPDALPSSATQTAPEEETLLPDVEYPLVVKVPPKARFRVQATIVAIRKGERRLGLSDADWESLGLEGDHE